MTTLATPVRVFLGSARPPKNLVGEWVWVGRPDPDALQYRWGEVEVDWKLGQVSGSLKLDSEITGKVITKIVAAATCVATAWNNLAGQHERKMVSMYVFQTRPGGDFCWTLVAEQRGQQRAFHEWTGNLDPVDGLVAEKTFHSNLEDL